MNNRLLLGAAVVMSNAVGLKKKPLLCFSHGNLSVHHSQRTMHESNNLCLELIVPVRKKSAAGWSLLYKLDLMYLIFFVVFVTVFDSC